MNFELTHPYFLLGLGFIFWIGWSYRRSLSDFSLAQRRVSLFVRVSILLMIVLALAGLNRRHPSHEPMLVFLTDHSRSIDENAEKIANEYLEKAVAASGDLPCITIPFAITPGTPTGKGENGEISHDIEWLNGTDIAAAIDLGSAMVPPDCVPSIVLISDGNETQGEAISAGIRNAVPVSVVPLPAAESPEVQLAELRIPPNVREGEPFFIDVIVWSNRATEGKITVYRGDFKVVEETKPLEVGENVFRFKQSLENQRQQGFSAVVEAKDDTIIDNNSASGLVFVGGKPRVLLLESDTTSMRDFASAMREQDIEIETRPPEGMPRTLDELENFDAIILSNIPATSLTMRQMDLLRYYVRDLGGGFIMLGGENSFGLGGYYKTPVEEILPLRRCSVMS